MVCIWLDVPPRPPIEMTQISQSRPFNVMSIAERCRSWGRFEKCEGSFSIFNGSYIFVFGSILALAQRSSRTEAPAQQTFPDTVSCDYGAVIRERFPPITDRLNLTREQELRIIAIKLNRRLQLGCRKRAAPACN
jgi:hypothetical protein